MSSMTDLPDRASESSADADAIIRVAERYVGAYQDRDLPAMLAVMDENVVSYPAPLFGHRPHAGHAGVRERWAAMMAGNETYDVVVSEVRRVDSSRVALLGEIHSRGRRLSPWAVLVRIRDGLIIESRSCLSDETLLDDLGMVEEAATTR
jgi:ketosteroid isomerase-like protein